MRLRTLPLSLAGVVCGGLLAIGRDHGSWWAFALVALTACLLQILSNLSNEMGDHLSGVDGDGRVGPNYSMTDGGLTVKQMWGVINVVVVLCAISGLLMLLFSFQFSMFNFQFSSLLALGAAAIWAATHYTLGRNPYGYRGLGDLFVFVFFGLVSVLGSYYVLAHTIDFKFWLLAPAVGIGLLSVAVLNVNNIRDMESDEGIRKTIPLRIGRKRAVWYQSLLIAFGWGIIVAATGNGWMVLTALPFYLHLFGVCRREGRRLDPMLPLLVISTFVMAVLYVIAVWPTISIQ